MIGFRVWFRAHSTEFTYLTLDTNAGLFCTGLDSWGVSVSPAECGGHST